MLLSKGVAMDRRSGFVLVIVGAVVVGCGGKETATEKTGQSVYVDSKTMQAVVGDMVAETPAVNPTTGERTLMPAMYCSSCQRWHPVPPPDQINRVPGATKCRKTGTTLTANGPWPK